MWDLILQIIAEIAVRLILWPVAMLVCTPFILLHSCYCLFIKQRRFARTIGDDYYEVSHFLEKWDW